LRTCGNIFAAKKEDEIIPRMLKIMVSVLVIKQKGKFARQLNTKSSV